MSLVRPHTCGKGLIDNERKKNESRGRRLLVIYSRSFLILNHTSTFVTDF